MSDVVLRVSCADDSAELVTVVLFEWGATAVGEIDADGSSRLEAGFVSMNDARAAAAAIETWATDVDIATVEPTWVEQQREFLRPTKAGRWTIRAPWHGPEADDDGKTIVIDPGVAFGHGGHASTRVALELLDPIVDTVDRSVDLGCGTGVLAIAMGRVGAAVDAVELDPDAADTARLNVVRNDLRNYVVVHDADAAAWSGGPYDLAVVNVTIDVHRLLVATLAEAELIIATGVLEHQVDELLELHATRTVVRRQDLDGWSGLVLGWRSAED